jgi:hypothetical protein
MEFRFVIFFFLISYESNVDGIRHAAMVIVNSHIYLVALDESHPCHVPFESWFSLA